MATAATTYGQALYQLTSGLPEKDGKRAIERFVRLLASRHELELAPKIISAYEQAARKAEGIREVSVASAEELPADRKKHLERAFAEALNSAVEMRWKTDPRLLAGADRKSVV